MLNMPKELIWKAQRFFSFNKRHGEQEGLKSASQGTVK
jgi:hypothetical protein